MEGEGEREREREKERERERKRTFTITLERPATWDTSAIQRNLAGLNPLGWAVGAESVSIVPCSPIGWYGYIIHSYGYIIHSAETYWEPRRSKKSLLQMMFCFFVVLGVGSFRHTRGRWHTRDGIAALHGQLHLWQMRYGAIPYDIGICRLNLN